jgi:uncharacterized protein (DUF1800 family)
MLLRLPIFVLLLSALCAGQAAPAKVGAQKPPANAASKSKSRPAPKPAALTPEQKAAHALSRLTFGPRPGDVQDVLARGFDVWFEQQLNPEAIDDKALDARLAPLRTTRMPARELVSKFPPQPVVRAVADGKQPMPEDPAVKIIYVAQIERYRDQQKQQRLQQQMQQMKPGETVTPVAADEMPEMQNDAAAAARLAEHLLLLPKGQRIAAMAQMQPAELQLLATVLKPEVRNRLLIEMTPEEREALLAMGSPNGVVTAEAMQAKLLRAIYSQRQLQEVMTDFWFNHFNVFIFKDADQYLIGSYERDVIRTRALGKFKDLLMAVAHSPAMLFYLDNWLSTGPESQAGVFLRNAAAKSGKPTPPFRGLNENYARELMELHTLGVNGGYTQQDVQEVAKVFTGWTIDAQQAGGPFAAPFKFDLRRHEPGTKTVLGQQIDDGGEQEGMQVLDILAHSPATAQFISTKLARRFVADEPPQSLIDRMAQTFLRSDGDIREVLRTMFRSSEFWSPKYFRAKMKTPLEFVASAARASGADVQNPQPLVGALARMGMPIYGAQPPTGYSTFNQAWTNSDALLDRMNFALQLASARLPGVQCDPAHTLAMEAFAVPPPVATAPPARRRAEANQPASPAEVPLKYLEAALLPAGVSAQTHNAVLKRLADPDLAQNVAQDPSNALRNMAGLLLGSPEFQQR